jgi:hypothetical protein
MIVGLNSIENVLLSIHAKAGSTRLKTLKQWDRVNLSTSALLAT